MTFFIGDLVNDEIDMAIASLTITSEREEVVDFITPYFDQSGISIAGRKPVRPRSLFKFLEVLHVEASITMRSLIVPFYLLGIYIIRISIYVTSAYTSSFLRFGWRLWQPLL